MEKYNIKLYHTENEKKSSIIERYNGTQNNIMKVIFEINKNCKWIDSLHKIVKIIIIKIIKQLEWNWQKLIKRIRKKY